LYLECRHILVFVEMFIMHILQLHSDEDYVFYDYCFCYKEQVFIAIFFGAYAIFGSFTSLVFMTMFFKKRICYVPNLARDSFNTLLCQN